MSRQTNMFKLGGMKKTPEVAPSPRTFRRGQAEVFWIDLTKSEIASKKYRPAVAFGFMIMDDGEFTITATWQDGTEYNEVTGADMTMPKRVWNEVAPWIATQMEKTK